MPAAPAAASSHAGTGVLLDPSCRGGGAPLDTSASTLHGAATRPLFFRRFGLGIPTSPSGAPLWQPPPPAWRGRIRPCATHMRNNMHHSAARAASHERHVEYEREQHEQHEQREQRSTSSSAAQTTNLAPRWTIPARQTCINCPCSSCSAGAGTRVRGHDSALDGRGARDSDLDSDRTLAWCGASALSALVWRARVSRVHTDEGNLSSGRL